YRPKKDFSKVSKFLIDTYRPGKVPNWLQPRWEYMIYHCVPTHNMTENDLEKIGIWKDSGKVVGVAHFEDRYGEVYFQVHPHFTYLKEEMLEYAENTLFGKSEDGKKSLTLFINDFDAEFETIAKRRGYAKDVQSPQYTSQYLITDPVPEITVLQGFSLKSLKEDNDLEKIHRVLWRGFNHPGEPPEEEMESHKDVQSAPNFKKELTIVAEAPNGNFVSYCGMWYEPVNKISYVEPVATDPDYLLMGLGKVVVLEAIRRTKELGSTVAYVGSGQKFYESIGFKKIFACYPWTKNI
ncbi:MAG: GNAT family N-acetyltransferase, partial [Methanomicrobia archaeon]|nr:GNAT family N-acetyltransferase [Methanomicrobia archaeon]